MKSSLSKILASARSNGKDGRAVDGVAESPAPREAEKSSDAQLHQEVAEVGEHEDAKYVTGYKFIFAMSALSLSVVLINLDSSILSTATPTITDEFHSVKDIGWYVSSYQLAVSTLQPLTGKFFTYFSNKASGISSPMFIIGRAIAGVGASGLFNGCVIILYAMIPTHKRPAATGVILAVSQVGMVAGPLIGGSLTQYTTWRWCFWINLPVGALSCVLLAVVHISEQVPKPNFKEFLRDREILQKFDLVGSAILVGTVTQLLLALHYGGGEYAWNSATVIGLFCGFCATTAFFLVWEQHAGDNALMPLGMFKNRVFACGSLMNLCLYGFTYITMYFIPIYFQSILGDSPMESGIHMLPSIISAIVFTLLSGVMVSKLGYCLPWAVFASMLTTISCGLMSTWTVTTSTGKWIGYQILLGTGRGLGMQMGLVAIQSILPPAQIAMAMTILVFVQGLGAAVLISVGNTVFDSTVVKEIRFNAPNVDAIAVIRAGATVYRTIVPPADLGKVVEAWNVGVQQTMYIATGLSVGMFLFAWGLGMNDVRKKTAPEAVQRSGEAQEA
ncbi:Efflux pump mlcE [Colletotrichum orbiculare MAFF 240422]|uniref:Efflux pump mlcE n=1 Tax=Colletotrichum orbiculare (strain 104-T / ATCC 96160 / CBS 514.97 / LARS 414 / MAFF 240422) TaxID=1213857 RepID=A0A484FTW3_COLOR|nr:Efflux pump mlcE [Colletotrichum orbiculare MAFF 240422]